MSVRVVSAEEGRPYRQFIRLPWSLYEGDASWVPPLRRDVADLLSVRNPFYQHAERKLFLCLKDGRPAGRIAAIVNTRHNEYAGDRTGFFGFFESEPDDEVAAALLGEAERFLAERGMDRCRGPMNPSTNEECGLLVDNFTSPPFLMTTYNPPSYQRLIEAAGYSKAKDLLGYFFFVGQKLPERLERLAKRIQVREPDLVTRTIDLKHFDREIGYIKTIYNDAWSKNWGFVPMTDAEMDHLAKRLKPLVVPDMIMLSFLGDEPAGFMMALPDYNQIMRIFDGRLGPIRALKALRAARKIRNPRIITLGVRERFRKRGLEAPLFAYAWGKGIERRDLYGEFSWVLEDNILLNETAAKIFGGTRYKTWRIYEKEISRAP